MNDTCYNDLRGTCYNDIISCPNYIQMSYPQISDGIQMSYPQILNYIQIFFSQMSIGLENIVIGIKQLYNDHKDLAQWEL